MPSTPSTFTDTAVAPGPVDRDGDGFDATVDCDDDDPRTYPGAAPRLFIDADCSGLVATTPDTADYAFSSFSGDRVTAIGSAGDVDGDGVPDLLITVQDLQQNASARIFLGASLPAAPATIPFNDADYILGGRIDGVSAVASRVGDVDGDGLEDIALSYPWEDAGGEIYIFLAGSLGADKIVDLSAAAHVLHGVDDHGAGVSLAPAGDVDGDGLDDFLVGSIGRTAGAAGRATLVLGSSLGPTRDLSLDEAAYTFLGEAALDDAGASVSSAGDVDGDGRPDLLIGAPRATPTAGSHRGGRAYVLLAANLVTGESPLAAADHVLEEVPVGAELDNSYLGSAVASMGDLDGDGRGDLLIGARGAWGLYPSYNDDGKGTAYVVHAADLTPVTTLMGVGAPFSTADTDYAGFSVASADLDGDGQLDAIIGAPGDEYYAPAGAIHLVTASPIAGGAMTAAFTISSGAPSSVLGRLVAGVPDLDGDGRDEVLMGSVNTVYLALSKL